MLLRELLLFALVGTLGFLVDAGVLLLARPALGLYGGRFLSFLCAATFTWFLNRLVTFAGRGASTALHRELSWYVFLMLGGGSFNYAVYALLVANVEQMNRQPVWAVAAGSLAGMLVNFGLARWLIFHGRD